MVTDKAVREEEWVLPVVCETTGCANEGSEINVISDISQETLEAFIEDWSRANGAEPEDFCPLCGQRGILYDPEVRTSQGRSGLSRNIS